MREQLKEYEEYDYDEDDEDYHDEDYDHYFEDTFAKIPPVEKDVHPNSVLPDKKPKVSGGAETNLLPPTVSKDGLKELTTDNVLIATKGSYKLAKFIQEPENAYVIRGKSARLTCAVTGADKAYFTCNGEAMAASKQHREVDKVMLADEDDMTGEMISVKSLTLLLSRNQVEEFFGVYTCRCDAWTSKGQTSSKNATVNIACESCEFKLVNLGLYHFFQCQKTDNCVAEMRDNLSKNNIYIQRGCFVTTRNYCKDEICWFIQIFFPTQVCEVFLAEKRIKEK